MKPQTRSVPPFMTNSRYLIAAGCFALLFGLFWAVRTAPFMIIALLYALAAASVYAVYYGFSGYMTSLQREREDADGYRELLEQVNDAILLISPKEPYRVLGANRSAYKRLGYEPEELQLLTAGDLTDIRLTVELIKQFKGRDRSETLYREINYKSKNQRAFPVEASVRYVRYKGQSAILVIARDLSEKRQMENKIRHMAYYDDMTGLPNRRLFQERLEAAMMEASNGVEGVAVFYLDIDRFKLVNDSFGHDYGDMLLMQVAERFTRVVGEKDFLARTEGDEFAFFRMGVKSADQLAELADGIQAVLELPFVIGEYQFHITASIGIAYYNGDPTERADTLMKYADIALSRSKEKGKNNYQIFHMDMNSISINKLTMENELRRAIVQQELMLYYQPQMEIESGSIIGMEALIRWKHPDRGFIPPKDFIPLAEETGLIVPIGEWVIKEACKQNKQWQSAGYPAVPVSVNLSVRQFLQPNLTGRIKSILTETGLEPRYLELEITESMTMDVEYAANALLELRELGVKISIDDFGTGYSSLSLLKKFPIDKLKIDRSFVRDIMVDPNDAAIVATIISMTKHLNLQVIAEGVETEEQLHFLHHNHCGLIQGYWFSPPIPADDMEDMLNVYGLPNQTRKQLDRGQTRKSVS